MFRLISVAAVAFLAGVGFSHAAELPRATPEAVGLSAPKLAELTPALRKLVDDGKIAGGVALIARHGKVAWTAPFGYRDLASKTPMTEDTIFRIASMTKPITCVAVMILVEQGKLELDDPVEKYLPELKEMRVLGDSKDDKGDAIATLPATRPITIRHLLAHTAGFAYGTRAPDSRLKQSYAPIAALEQSPGIWHDGKTIADLTRELGKVALVHQPGERWTYGLSHDVLGRVVEVVSGEGFDHYLQEHILKPLDMGDTFFLVPETKRDRVATLYLAGLLGKLAPLPANYGSATFFSGGGGLFSTARDYSRFAQMLLQGGTFEGQRIVRPETMQAMTTSQIGEAAMVIPGIAAFAGLKYGLGFGLEPVAGTGSGGAAPVLGRYFWGGAFSTNFWVDTEHDLVAEILTQVLPFNYGGTLQVFRGVVDAAIEK